MQTVPHRDPLEGELPELRRRHGVHTSIGRTLRKGDAKLLLASLEQAETAIADGVLHNQEIQDRLQRCQAAHKQKMDYLLRFGVLPAERHEMKQVLREVAAHGGLDLREAARLAHARYVQANGDPGESVGGDVPSVSEELGS